MAAPHNKFTDEQIAYFKCNRHVRSIGRSFVYFNDEFKEQFWRMYSEENLLPQEILLRLGVDYKMLGRKRVEGIAQNIKKKYANGIAEDKRRRRQVDLNNERQLFRLRAEIEYLRQENDFLKKIVSADREAKR
jgi:hypothetical protein